MLYLTLIDIEREFDSINHRVLWNIRRHFYIQDNFIHNICQLYDGITCQVIHGESLADPFPVPTGVWEGRLLSTILCLLVTYWVKQKSTGINPNSMNKTKVRGAEIGDVGEFTYLWSATGREGDLTSEV